MTTILILLGLIAVLVGLLGTIYPAIPGLGLMFGGAWLLAYSGNYQVYGTNTLIFIGIAAAFGMAMDYVSGVVMNVYWFCYEANRLYGARSSAALPVPSFPCPACCSVRSSVQELANSLPNGICCRQAKSAWVRLSASLSA